MLFGAFLSNFLVARKVHRHLLVALRGVPQALGLEFRGREGRDDQRLCDDRGAKRWPVEKTIEKPWKNDRRQSKKSSKTYENHDEHH